MFSNILQLCHAILHVKNGENHDACVLETIGFLDFYILALHVNAILHVKNGGPGTAAPTEPYQFTHRLGAPGVLLQQSPHNSHTG